MVSASTATKWISAIYQDIVVAPGDGVSEIDIINAKPGGSVVLRLDKDYGPSTVVVRECSGRTLNAETRQLGAGVHLFEVPASGLLEIRRQFAK